MIGTIATISAPLLGGGESRDVISWQIKRREASERRVRTRRGSGGGVGGGEESEV